MSERIAQPPRRLYLAGPMTGYPEHNVPAFHAGAARLRGLGYPVVSPAETDGEDQEDRSWEEWMQRDIKLLVGCDAVACLPGWEHSRGATLEVHIARALGMDIVCAETLQPLPAPERVDLVAHLHRQRCFSESTFGPGARVQGVLDHIRKELREIETDPADLYEWIDVVLLALDGAWRQGFTPEQIAAALVAKQARNESRQWPDWRTADPNKAIEHTRLVPVGSA